MNTWVQTKKLTKANSHMSGDTIFWIGKKLNDEKAAKDYWAYLYPTGYVIRGDKDKDILKQWLDDNIVRIEAKITEKGIG